MLLELCVMHHVMLSLLCNAPRAAPRDARRAAPLAAPRDARREASCDGPCEASCEAPCTAPCTAPRTMHCTMHHALHHVMHHLPHAQLCLKQLSARLVAIRPEMSVAHRQLVWALHRHMPTHTCCSAVCLRPATHCMGLQPECTQPYGRRCLWRPRPIPSSSLPTVARPPCSNWLSIWWRHS